MGFRGWLYAGKSPPSLHSSASPWAPLKPFESKLTVRQIHFPDHTKLVLSSPGTLISATCISPEGSDYLSTHSTLLPHHITGREILADSVHALLHESGRVRARMVRANDLVRKLEFVSEVVGQWISNGGLGRLDADAEVGGEKLYWEGAMVRDQARKVERVTVGRCGGDVRAAGDGSSGSSSRTGSSRAAS